MSRKVQAGLATLLFAALALVLGPDLLEGPARTGAPPSGAPERVESPGPASTGARGTVAHPGIGFRSRAALAEHFEKHGAEFGARSEEEYLGLAQGLRDARVGGDVLEVVRDDGVVTRFDRRSGAFVAFQRDLTLRTFFKPNDGERYFERQAGKEHE